MRKGNFRQHRSLPGTTFSSYICDYDHWIAFGLLVFVGGRMLYQGLRCYCGSRNESSDAATAGDCRKLTTLLILSVATSIDALAVGISFAMIDLSIIMPVVLIGTITFATSLFGYFLGKRIGHRLNLPLEAIGGVVLVLIGVKVVVDHLA